jgi:nucleotide-binding universal stress UspA family protein
MMAKNILVPLSNRESAREIVPLVSALARGGGASVRLLQVLPLPEQIVGPYGRVIAYADQEMQRLTAAGLDDLRTAETDFHDVPLESVVRFGDPVEEILLEAEAFGADLIAFATSGRGRLRRALSLGVAEQVARQAPVPTLLLRSGAPGAEAARRWPLA